MRFVRLLWVLALVGCARNRSTQSLPDLVQAARSDYTTAVHQADDAWSGRDDRAQLEAALAAYAAAHQALPGERYPLTRLARGWYLLGDGHLLDDVEARSQAFDTARQWGERCIALNPSVQQALDEGQKLRDAVSSSQRDDVPCLYWTATALGKWAKLQPLSKTLRYIPTVKALISKVEALDPDYFYSGPSRFWGAYYAALPSFAGRDLLKSGDYFDHALAESPMYLATRTLRAELLWVARQDRDAFVGDLQGVLDAPEEVSGHDLGPENRLEKRKATRLLSQQDELFERRSTNGSEDR